MNQQELEARLAQIAPGGDPNQLQFIESTKAKKVKRQTSEFSPPTEVEIQVPVRTWINRQTGHTVTIEVDDEGAYVKAYDGVDEKNKDARSASSPAEQRTAREEAEIAANAALPPDQDPRPETNKQRADRAEQTRQQQGKDAQEAAIRNGQVRVDPTNVTRIQKPDPNNPGQWIDAGLNDVEVQRRAKENAPKTDVVERNGKQYTVQTTPGVNGAPPTIKVFDATGAEVPGGLPSEAVKPTATQIIEENGEKKEVIRNPDGSIKELRPLPGAATGAGSGPRMPSILADQQSETLTNYHNTLSNDPTLTPAQRERRFAEAVQVATFAQAEARRQQDEMQSNRGAHVNVAMSRLSYMQAGMQQALSFVDSINGKLPPGSDLGAKAFVALLNLQMIRAKDSGIYDLYPPGTRGPWTGVEADRGMSQRKPDSGPPKLTNPNNPEAVEQQRQESHQRVQAIFTPQPVAPPPAGTPEAQAAAPAAPAPAPASRPMTPPFAGAPPAAPAPAVMPPGPVPSSGGAYAPQLATPGGAPAPAPVAPPVGVPDPAADGGIYNPAMSSATGAPEPGMIPAPMPPGAVPDTGGVYDPSQASGSGFDPHNPGQPRVQMAPAPDYAALAAYAEPAPIPSAGGVSMPPPTPDLNFAALNPYQQQSAVQMPEQQSASTMGTPPAMLHSIAASTPPWMLSNDQIQEMIDAGVDEQTIFGVPGRTVA